MTTFRDKLLESTLGEWDYVLTKHLGPVAATCGSPIEVALLEAMSLRHLMIFHRWPSFNKALPTPGKEATELSFGWEIYTQFKIDQYRVDFAIKSNLAMTQTMIVECDGHEFHERTKEQAARDRKRDRTLTSLGYCVIRFTGSEIWRDPWQCAQDVSSQMQTLWEDENLPL